MIIRAERESDLPLIRQILESAFEGQGEADLVDLLRQNDALVCSLVAEVDGNLVGHILFSPVSLVPEHSRVRIAGLAPLAVLPEYQNRGIGSQLILAGLEFCRKSAYQAVIVLGHPGYYPRFGFRPASEFNLGNDYGVDQAFMALELTPGGLNGVQGIARYRPEFGQVDV
jgi:putative acetyltransferase